MLSLLMNSDAHSVVEERTKRWNSMFEKWTSLYDDCNVEETPEPPEHCFEKGTKPVLNTKKLAKNIVKYTAKQSIKSQSFTAVNQKRKARGRRQNQTLPTPRKETRMNLLSRRNKRVVVDDISSCISATQLDHTDDEATRLAPLAEPDMLNTSFRLTKNKQETFNHARDKNDDLQLIIETPQLETCDRMDITSRDTAAVCGSDGSARSDSAAPLTESDVCDKTTNQQEIPSQSDDENRESIVAALGQNNHHIIDDPASEDSNSVDSGVENAKNKYAATDINEAPQLETCDRMDTTSRDSNSVCGSDGSTRCDSADINKAPQAESSDIHNKTTNQQEIPNQSEEENGESVVTAPKQKNPSIIDDHSSEDSNSVDSGVETARSNSVATDTNEVINNKRSWDNKEEGATLLGIYPRPKKSKYINTVRGKVRRYFIE